MDVLTHAEILRKIRTGEYSDTELTEALISLGDDYAAVTSERDNVIAVNNNLVEENTRYKEQNTDLYQRIGEQITGVTENGNPKPAEEKRVTFDDLFDEDGKW